MTAFAAIGLDHNHIFGQVRELLDAGGRLAGFATEDDARAAEFEERFPDAVRKPEAELLEDPEVALVTSAAIPADRAALAVRAMEAGKDVLLDKPGVITRDGLSVLRTAHERTGRRVRVHYSELESVPTVQTALRLVRAGEIGEVLHYSGTGPHRLDQGVPRPVWFYDRARNGGILVDIASHQIAKFLAFTGRTRATVDAARVACLGERPDYQDLGDMMLSVEGAQAYARVDWYTPPGLPTWGDGRIILTGSKGTLELRKYIDPLGKGEGGAVILTNDAAPRDVPVEPGTSDFTARVLADAAQGTETAMDQATAFHIMELALTAQQIAEERA